MSETGGAAFPMMFNAEGYVPEWQEGMSLRDYFAAAAITGILANQPRFWDDECVTLTVEGFMNKEAAAQAYRVADQMIKRRGVQ